MSERPPFAKGSYVHFNRSPEKGRVSGWVISPVGTDHTRRVGPREPSHQALKEACVVRHWVLSENTAWVVALVHRVAAHQFVRLNRSGLGGKVLEQGVLTTQNQSRMVWA